MDSVILSLTPQEAHVLMAIMQEAPIPYKVSAPLIAKLQAAWNEANASAQKPEDAAAK